MTITLKIGGATTGRKFTDPIRYFKANDPYYWEVDNIPLKQLQENVKYVNDRLNTAIVSGNLDTSRNDIAELKPYVNGSDDKVRVKPGRYTARINNAHGIDRLDSFIRHISSDTLGNYTNYAWTDSTALDALITRIQSAVAEDSLNLNGLSERVFAQLTRNPDEVVDPDDEESGYPRTIYPLPSAEDSRAAIGDALPISEWLGWHKHWWNYKSGVTGSTLFQRPDQDNEEPNKFLNLPILENALIKYWRGTARTAIVDVPEELDISIPPFNASVDFPGVTGATSRIDLVFIYSKPVDTSAVTIGKYSSGGEGRVRSKITEPILGVLHGAGLAVDTSPPGRYQLDLTNSEAIGLNGKSHMMASVADQNNTDNGFKVGVNQTEAIHGSFPSPEDLLNIAPLLSEQLEEDSWFLTGQTIFPVAYVRVKESAGLNVRNAKVLTDADIIDIRPLFRTAELTYNERAGIAAAMPPLSLANRAVGKYELEYEINNLYKNHQDQLDFISKSQMTFVTEHTQLLEADSIVDTEAWAGQLERGKILFNTFSDPYQGLITKIGLNTAHVSTGGVIYDLASCILPGICPDIKNVKYVILMIMADKKAAKKKYAGAVLPPILYINAETTGGNVTECKGRSSRYADMPMMRWGKSRRSANGPQDWGGASHTFMQPVEANSKGELNIFTFCHSSFTPDNQMSEYYQLSVMGYVYDKLNIIKLVP